jgi:hypothetical protein
MSQALWRLVRTARKVGKTNPILGYELERRALAVINPGARKFEQNLDNTVTVLEALKDELEDALLMLDTEDAKEFAKFFEDAAEAEEEELRQMLRKVSSTAGFKDFFNKFKEVFKPKKGEGDETKANEPSYQMDESTMDEFVEGKRDWADPEHYIDQEAKENAKFFGGVEKVLNEMEEARKKPNRQMIQDILKKVNVLINKGKNISKGIREHLLGTPPKADMTEEGMKPEKKSEPGKMTPEQLDSKVTYYADLLKDSSGDQAKTVKYLKELFHAVKPLLHEDRAELASAKIRAAAIFTRHAYAMPALRSRILPIVYRLTGR